MVSHLLIKPIQIITIRHAFDKNYHSTISHSPFPSLFSFFGFLRLPKMGVEWFGDLLRIRLMLATREYPNHPQAKKNILTDTTRWHLAALLYRAIRYHQCHMDLEPKSCPHLSPRGFMSDTAFLCLEPRLYIWSRHLKDTTKLGKQTAIEPRVIDGWQVEMLKPSKAVSQNISGPWFHGPGALSALWRVKKKFTSIIDQHGST